MKIVVRIMNGEKNIQSPFDKNGIIDFVFVIFDDSDTSDRIGYLLFWCSVTHKGGTFSRLKVPENAKCVKSSEFKKLNLPEIKLQQIKF